MKTIESAVLCMLERAQHFLNAKPDLAGSFATSTSRLALDTAITDLRQAAIDQGTAATGGLCATQTQRALRTALVNDHMRPIAAIGRSLAEEYQWFPELRVSPKRCGDCQLCTEALAMADLVEPYVGRFINAGLALDFVEQLRQAAHDLAEVATHRGTQRTHGISATAGIKVAVKRGRTAIDTIDAVLAPRLRHDPSTLAQWRSLTRISSQSAARGW